MAAAPASAPLTKGTADCQRGLSARPYCRASARHCCSATNCTAVYGTVSSWPGTVPRQRPCGDRVGRVNVGALQQLAVDPPTRQQDTWPKPAAAAVSYLPHHPP